MEPALAFVRRYETIAAGIEVLYVHMSVHPAPACPLTNEKIISKS